MKAIRLCVAGLCAAAVAFTVVAAVPADAVPEAREAAHWVSSFRGGAGAVRELVEFILKSQARWESAVEEYLEYLAAQR